MTLTLAKNMKLLTITLLLFASNVFALDSDEIRKIAAEPNDRKNLIKELKLYPGAREYKIAVKNGVPGGQLKLEPELVAEEKVVRGRYLVSKVKFPNVKDPLIMVVTYDNKTDAFKKWVLLPDGVVISSTGVADVKMRTIAWISDKAQGNPPTTVLSIETHADDRSTWKETTLHDGKVVWLSRGVAIKTK